MFINEQGELVDCIVKEYVVSLKKWSNVKLQKYETFESLLEDFEGNHPVVLHTNGEVSIGFFNHKSNDDFSIFIRNRLDILQIVKRTIEDPDCYPRIAVYKILNLNEVVVEEVNLDENSTN